MWWPTRHLEATTKPGYRSYLDKHLIPFVGAMPMIDIKPSTAHPIHDGLEVGSASEEPCCVRVAQVVHPDVHAKVVRF